MAANTDSSCFSKYSDDSFNTHHLPSTSTAPLSNKLDKKNSQGLLVGPSDCRRLGAQLRPHIFSRLFHLDTYRCAGLVSKDLSEIGGHQVLNFGEAALELEDGDLSLIHIGCDNTVSGLVSGYHSATEGIERNRVRNLIQLADRDEMEGYVKRRSGQTSPLAYVLAPKGSYSGSDLSFFGLRLPEPSVLEEDQEEHLVYCTGEASFVGVSGHNAEKFLTERGVNCEQMPCGLAVLPRLCGKQLGNNRKLSPAIKNLRDRFGKGWIAVEVSDIPERQENDFATAVSSLAAAKGWGIVIYSAKSIGSVPETTRNKWNLLLGSIGEAVWFDSDNIWDITRMIGNASFYVGSCLDSRIIASSFCVPRINTPRADHRNVDYCSVWELESLPAVLSDEPELWASEMDTACNVDRSLLQEHAEATARAFFEGFSKACEKTELSPRLFAGETIDHHQAVAHGQKIAADWMKTAEDRKRFAKLNQGRDFSKSKPTVKDGVKKVVQKFKSGS